MTASGGGLFALVLLIGIGLSLGLYVLVRAEGADREVVDRADAERIARRDTDDEK